MNRVPPFLIGVLLCGAAIARADQIDSTAPTVPSAAPVPPGCREIEINGPRLSGTSLDHQGGRCGVLGAELSAVTLKSGVVLADGKLHRELVFQGGALRGNSGALQPSDLKGALFLARTATLGVARVKIDEISEGKTPKGQAVPLYRLSYQWSVKDRKPTEPSDNGFLTDGPRDVYYPLCPGGARALILPGGFAHSGKESSTDPGTITFACEDASLGKCALRLGYLPYASAPGVASLASHHRACVRALRADYCGDGVAHTAAGTPINIYDAIGVQRDDAAWPVEADFGESGALCLSQPRWTQVPGAKAPVRKELPADCTARLRPCGPAMTAGALLRIEARPDAATAAAPAGSPAR